MQEIERFSTMIGISITYSDSISYRTYMYWLTRIKKLEDVRGILCQDNYFKMYRDHWDEGIKTWEKEHGRNS